MEINANQPHEEYSDPDIKDLHVTLMNLPRITLLAIIRLYQITISKALPQDTCRFYPSCSHYGYQAVFKYGVIRGGLLAVWRILRCNPFNPGGIDPVP
jgi:putative membrane protein insertion efficiency factor